MRADGRPRGTMPQVKGQDRYQHYAGHGPRIQCHLIAR
ncbi:hypothetical protein C791_5296 [Amycolatopsis azurea DSM 43854]|uniref:Uncharacterized protein n=1 Tax=Amycolatopsis azurea DSM 43854 TaxID=1238180 RepID=M2QG39_9PSEU|nr:hypothetical protein C791_5296 [Amycolatopsis azurea DSM 43854]